MTDLLGDSAHAQAAGAIETDTASRLGGRRIVIAVDGSPASVEALRWAKDEVIEAGDVVCVITAFHPPSIAPEAPPVPLATRESAECARATAEEAIRSVMGPDEPGGSVEHVVAPGSIERVAARHGVGAALLVLGARPRHRFLDRIRPSATKRITGRASCPVVCVPYSNP